MLGRRGRSDSGISFQEHPPVLCARSTYHEFGKDAFVGESSGSIAKVVGSGGLLGRLYTCYILLLIVTAQGNTDS